MLTLFTLARHVFDLSEFVNSMAGESGIAVAHTAFNILCTAVLLPASGLLEKLSYKIVPEAKNAEQLEDHIQIDERLMTTPAVALEQCRLLTGDMAGIASSALKLSAEMFYEYNPDKAAIIREKEDLADKYEDALGSYLVKLNSLSLAAEDSMESSKLLHMIGDLERLSDHAVNLLASAEELNEKGIAFTAAAKDELETILGATDEILDLAMNAFKNNDLTSAIMVEPLKQIVDVLKNRFRSRHIQRMQKGECTIEAGFVWSDLLTNLGRVADHCSNIAGCVIELSSEKLDLHDYSKMVRSESNEYAAMYRDYAEKYLGGE